MKKNIFLATLFLILIIVIPVFGIFSTSSNEIVKTDNRPVADFPSELNKRVLIKFDRYLKDRLLLKNVINENFSNTFYKLYLDGVGSTVIKGKNNWLFLGDNYDLNYSKHFRNLSIDYKKLYSYIRQIEEIEANSSIDFSLVIAPDKDVIYKEFHQLPINDSNRYLTKLLPYLEKYFETIDLTDALVKVKHKIPNLLYLVDDSHWNRLGAYYSYQKILNNYNMDFPSLNFVQAPHIKGDLQKTGIDTTSYYKMVDTFVPKEFIDYNIKIINSFDHKLIQDFPILDVKNSALSILNDSGFLLSINPNALYRDTVLVVSDSYGTNLVPYLQYSFSKVLWINTYLKQDEIIEIINKFLTDKPKIAIYLNVERRVGS